MVGSAGGGELVGLIDGDVASLMIPSRIPPCSGVALVLEGGYGGGGGGVDDADDGGDC